LTASASDYSRPPRTDELEVSLLGPGYGESAVLHVGDGDWIVVDSCVDPTTHNAAALDYLAAIGAQPNESVKYILATHWHDDHIGGLAQLVDACASAEFACSVALRQGEFLALVAAETYGPIKQDSGVRELASVMEVLKGRAQESPKWALANRRLWQSREGATYEWSLHTLSPSDDAVARAQLQLAALLPEPLRPKRRIVSLTPNHASVAAWLDIGDISVLLGGDVEAGALGWDAILQSSERPAGLSTVYKVAHHGSQEDSPAAVWTDLLVENPWALLSPWSLGGHALPTEAGRAAICRQTSRAHQSQLMKPGHLDRDPRVEKMIRESVRYLRRAEPSTGHVRLRGRADGGEPFSWEVEHFAGAGAIC
jgi:beta-lactamase superfamily II metal-dependent hydrolase